MSIKQLLSDNDLKLFVNTTDRGVNLNGTVITSSGSTYKFILPVNTPTNINSILAVASLVDDNILLHWIAPTGGPIIPIDVINCNTLNATVSVNTVQLEVNNNMTGGSVKFVMDGANDSTYILPDDLPTQDSVLVSNNTGVLRWVNPSIEPIPERQSFFYNAGRYSLEVGVWRQLWSHNFATHISGYYRMDYSMIYAVNSSNTRVYRMTSSREARGYNDPLALGGAFFRSPDDINLRFGQHQVAGQESDLWQTVSGSWLIESKGDLSNLIIYAGLELTRGDGANPLIIDRWTVSLTPITIF